MENLNTSVYIQPYDSTKSILFLLDKPEIGDASTKSFNIENYTILQNILAELPEYIRNDITFGFLSPHPTKQPTDTVSNKTLYSLFSQNLYQELSKNPPKIIIGFGSAVAFSLGIENKIVNELRTVKESFKTSSLYFTYGYSYLKYVGGDSVGKKYFDSTLNDIKTHLGLLTKDDSEKIDYETLHWNDIERLPEIFKDDDHIVFDYETQGLDIKLPYFYVGSIGFYGIQSKKSVYLSLYSLEHLWTQENRSIQDEKVKEVLYKFFSDESKTFICFNCTYEFQVTAIHYGYKFKTLEDVLQLARTLGYSGSLKEQASSKLNIVKWNDQVADWLDVISEFKSKVVRILKSTKTKPETTNKIYRLLDNPESSLNDLVDIDDTFLEICSKVNTLIKSFYGNDQENKKKVLKCQSDTLSLLNFLIRTNTECNFTQLPEDILGVYCIYDVINTYKLYELYLQEARDLKIPESTLQVFYHQGLLACELDLNGTYWDEKEALRLEKHYIESASQNLRKFLLMDLSKKALFKKWYNEEFEKALADYKGDTFNYTQSGNPEDLPSDFPMPELRTDYSQMQYIEIKTGSLETLKNYYNPNSNKKDSVRVFSESMMTQRVKLARMIFEIWTYLDQGDVADTQYPILSKYCRRIRSLDHEVLAKELKDEYSRISTAIESHRDDFTHFEFLESEHDFYKFINDQDNALEFLKECMDREFEIKYLKRLQGEAFSILEEVKNYILMNSKRDRFIKIFTKQEQSVIRTYLGKDYMIEGCNAEVMMTLYKTFQFICKVYTNELVRTKNTVEMKDIESKLNELSAEESSDKSTNSDTSEDIIVDNEIERNMDDKVSWIPEFKALICIRSFKKILKNYNACINGKMGRNQVIIVDKEDSLKKIYKAKAWYSDRPIDPETEVYMKNYHYVPNSADTKRFKSSEHVIPNSNELQNLRGMRYGDKGIRIYGDFANNEVRVFAKVADDPELIKLLLDPDSDPHMYFASKSLRKDPKFISKAERRYCLDGESEIVLANNSNIKIKDLASKFKPEFKLCEDGIYRKSK